MPLKRTLPEEALALILPKNLAVLNELLLSRRDFDSDGADEAKSED